MNSTLIDVELRKQIRLGSSEHIGVGIDVHKKTFSVCLWSVEEDREIKRWTQPSDHAALIRKLSPLRDQVRQISYEAGPTGFVLARALAQDNWPVLVTSPADIPTSRNAPKSDRKDARHLARLAAKNMLPRCYIPSVQYEDERRLVRLRGRMLTDKNRVQLRIKSLLLCAGIDEPEKLKYWSRQSIEELRKMECSEDVRLCLNVHLSQLEQTRQLLSVCDKQLQEIAERAHNQPDVAVLTQVPGIGTPSCIQFMSEMGPRHRFRDRLEVAKYQGLAPDVRSSGESRTGYDLNNSGNRRLRTMLIEAAWRWIRYDTNARTLYVRMLHNTGCSQKAIVAVARKLGIVLWHLRETQGDYDTTKILKEKSTK